MMNRVVKTQAEWKAQLTPEQFRITRQKKTEPAFSSPYWDCHDEGTYSCICCGNSLFSSEDKFDSKTGWPSFTRPIRDDAVAYRTDICMLIRRTEVLCVACDAHLGHVFDDGPGPAGKRYCINGTALLAVLASDDTQVNI